MPADATFENFSRLPGGTRKIRQALWAAMQKNATACARNLDQAGLERKSLGAEHLRQ